MSTASNAHAASAFEQAPTIRDLEVRMETVLDSVRHSSSSTSATEAHQILAELRTLIAPSRFRATIELKEEGRKKRSTAAATNWGFQNGEIVLYFEAATGEEEAPVLTMPAQEVKRTQLDIENEQCCEALAQAEAAGKHFIALKWFRDFYLPALPFSWAKSPDSRQRVLAQALESGAIQTKKIPNPKAPMFPTTTLNLNRASKTVSIESRFSPIPVKGEPVSATLLRDRGER